MQPEDRSNYLYEMILCTVMFSSVLIGILNVLDRVIMDGVIITVPQ